ncbi:MAG: T9SS type A sorting domain-containing protein, partial [Actinobacteria bacterium]|nr:T9SS type A sorting domain-containing protein [Actinomycetota bacterium]
PGIEITFDGKEIVYNDLVAARPHILAKISDNSPVPITDTSRVDVVLDGKRINFFGAAAVLSLRAAGDDHSQGIIEFKPELQDGDHLLEFYVSDASGNRIYSRVDFRVVSELQINRVVNFPNPFSRATDFTFELTQPARVDIKVYTVAGRLIRSFDAGWCNAGFNNFHWDGRDADGDRLANGVYLYKIFAAGEKKKVEETSKLIVMR